MNYTLLQERFDAANKPDAEFLTEYNAPTIAVNVPVSSVDVATHLMTTLSHHSTPTAPLTLYNVLSLTYRNDGLPETVRAHAENAIDLATGVERALDMNGNPMYGMMLATLVGAGRFSADEAADVLGLGAVMQSQSVIDHGRETTQADLSAMRNQPAIPAVESLLNGATNGYNAALVELQANLRALQNGEEVAALTKADVVALFEAQLTGELG